MTLAFLKGSLRERLVALGAAMYVLYVIYIGGDFMSGRFFYGPMIVGALLLVRNLPKPNLIPQVAVLYMSILLGMLSPAPTLWNTFRFISSSNFDRPYIHDERSFYYGGSSLLLAFQDHSLDPIKNGGWAQRGIVLRAAGSPQVVVEENIGYTGFYAGPAVHIVDRDALSDAFLARLPLADLTHWRIGHFSRKLPPGYLATIQRRKPNQ